MGNLDSYFLGLEKQEERKIKSIEVDRNPNVDEIVKSYEWWIDFPDENEYWNHQYNYAIKFIKKITYDSKTVTEFSLKLKNYEKHKFFRTTGLFLSALINKSKYKEFEIVTEHLGQRIDLIGYYNTKNITVIGDAGNYIGRNMKGGIIKIIGNSENHAGLDMLKGIIDVKGNTGDYTGYWMRGGLLKVKGNTGKYTGCGMGKGIGCCTDNGILRIGGQIGSLSKALGNNGKIYHKGKLIRGGGVK